MSCMQGIQRSTPELLRHDHSVSHVDYPIEGTEHVLDPPVGLHLLLQLGLGLGEPLLDLGHQLGEHLVCGGCGQDILLGDWWLGACQGAECVF